MRKTTKAPAHTATMPLEQVMASEEKMQQLVKMMAQLEVHQHHDKDVLGQLGSDKHHFEQCVSQLKQDKNKLRTQTHKNQHLQQQLVKTLREQDKKQKKLMHEIEIKQRQTHKELWMLRKERDAALAQKTQLQTYAKISHFIPEKLHILLHPKVLLLIIAMGLLLSVTLLLFLL